MIGGGLRIALLALLGALHLTVGLAGAASADAGRIDLLNREVRVAFGPIAGAEVPAFDDSAWDEQAVLTYAGWEARGAAPEDHIMWMRMDFATAEVEGIAQPALHLGVLTASIVYVNGVEIGRIGALDRPFAGAFQTHLKALPQVYAIPVATLAPDGVNVLAIKSVRNSAEPSGLMSGPLEITSQTAAWDAAKTRTVVFVFLGAFFSVLILIAAIVAGLIWLSVPRGSGVGWLFATLLLYAPYVVCGSGLALYLGPPVPLFVYPFMATLIGSFSNATLLEFTARILKRRITPWVRCVQIGSMAIVLVPDFSDPMLFPNDPLEDVVWTLLVLISYMIITYWAVSAWRRGQRAALAIVWGAAIVWVSVLISMLALEGRVFALVGMQSIDIALPVLLVAFAWAGLQDTLGEARRRLVVVEDQVLSVQDAERKRVANDLHDGVGQWLSAIRLNLKILESQNRDDAATIKVSDVVEHVDSAIADTRRIAHDLSPEMLAKLGLRAAMQEHCARLSGGGRVHAKLELTDVRLPENTEAHLYRIFQEALSNAIKHGAAKTINVRLSSEPPGYVLSISDDGIGFDPGAVPGGLGISSMENRARSIGATLKISAAPEGGTIVRVAGKLDHA